MSPARALAVTLLGVVIAVGGLAIALNCSPEPYGCDLVNLYAWPVAVAGVVLFIIGLVLWLNARDDQVLGLSGLCPVCDQPVVLDSRKGSWYCPSCRRYR